MHAGLGGFRPERPLADYTADELIWHRPGIDERYFEDIYNTPTALFGKEYEGEILFTDTWACIDCGVNFGADPILLRLDDMQQFRLQLTNKKYRI